MEPNWSEAKKVALWNYEELMEKMLKVLSYKFVQEHYNHSMKEAADYATRLFGYDAKYAKKVGMLTEFFKKLDSLEVKNYVELARKTETKEKCREFLRKTRLPFEDLISTLNYIFRWVLPFNLYLRELIDPDDETQREYVEKLKKLGIRFNLDTLEQGRTVEGRKRISEEAGVPEIFLSGLVNHADLTRLPYSNRKTVKHLCAAGYGTLEKLAGTDLRRLTEDMKSYFDKVGIRLSRSFIDLEGISHWAKTIPRIVQD